MKILRAFSLLLLCASAALHAQVPPLINYQGRVAVNGTNFEGTGQFKFALVNGDGSVTFWSNDGTAGEPTNAVSLTVNKGLYSALLGDSAVMSAIPASIFTNPDIRLRVWFNDGANDWQLLSPDQRLAPMPYLADGSVTSAVIANGAVTSANIAQGAINGSHVAQGSLDFSRFTVPAPPGPGQVLSFDGQSLLWTTPSGDGGGNSPWSTLGSTVYYNAGRVGIGTNAPAHQLSVIGGPTWTSHGWKGALELDTASAIGWRTNFGGQRFGIGHTGAGFYMFRTASDPGNNANPAQYDFVISDTGNVGIGLTNPTAKLDIRGAPNSAALQLSDGAATFFTSVGSSGAALGTASAHPIRFFVNAIPIPILTISESGSVSTTGAVGIGTGNPLAELHVRNSGFTEVAVQSTNERAIVSLNSTVGGENRVWTLESGLFGTAGLFGIYDRTAQRARLTIDANGTVSVPVLSITGGADIAEPFPMNEEATESGSVVVIDPENPGHLKRSWRAYDKRVAGVISGANGVNPGIALHQEGRIEGDRNVALSGRVYVHADATRSPIEPGDLLTTSDKPGHAMKAVDHKRAQGAVLGKAMTPLREGTGLVLVLVTLQ